MDLIVKFYSADGGQTRMFAAADRSSARLVVIDPVSAQHSVAFEGGYAEAVSRLATAMQAAPAAPVMAASPAAGISIEEMVEASDDDA